ncbi:tripartite tricarboxylate transporter TctB family protein [Nonomuraea polychroma]|uniref:Tripartite tricarboxylate transporter TctB family protein n=1 Tax=Nonomuraea polychroma TaxID=46176 RepID=A0A438M8I3_9ACTN|nr:tripartite tricarboxylate transporter TctB family protein [Nonomuraea polychroma]RVX41998.1 tripartite tricarboxylate transporter TctB family protein [Nonomuraea polychroma]
MKAIAYAVLACLGVAFFAGSFGYRVLLEHGQVGPGFLPMAAGALLAVLNVVLLFQEVRQRRPEPEPAADELDIHGRTSRQRARMLWWVYGLTLAALLLVPIAGFLLSLGLLVLVISTVIERRPVPASLAVTALSVAVIYLVFVLFLEVPLPMGVLETS